MDFDIDSEDLDKFEPQVTSSDPDVRKLARALRIRRRIEIIKKENSPVTDEEIEANKTSLEVQMLKSVEQLQNLLIEGEELTTNIRVGAYERDVRQYKNESNQRINLIKQIEKQAAEAEIQNKEIEKIWIALLLQNDALDIHDGIGEQKDRCRALIQQKDDILVELRAVINQKELEFERDQEQQKRDLTRLSNIIEKQVELMTNAYKLELQLIEYEMSAEKLYMKETNLEKWKILFEDCEVLEDNNTSKRRFLLDQFIKDLQDNRVQYEEKFREMKISLENKNQVLQQEIEYLNTFCLINLEKVNVNYQTYKIREGENVIIKSQQKRHINKLRDGLIRIRKKGEEYREIADAKEKRLIHEITRLRNSVFGIETKADLLKKTNEKKYLEVWKYNDDMAKEKLQQILTTDRIITEQFLGVDWVYPKFTFHDKTFLRSYRTTIQMMDSRHYDTTESELDNTIESSYTFPLSIQQKIFECIGDRSGFLLEDQLRKLVKKMKTEAGNLIKMETVFECLGIKNIDEMEHMLKSFGQYLYCETCNVNINIPSVYTKYSEQFKAKHMEDTLSSVLMKKSSKSSLSLFSQDDLLIQVNLPLNIIEKTLATKEHDDESDKAESYISPETIDSMTSESQNLFSSRNMESERITYNATKFHAHHPLSIETAYINKALKHYVLRFNADKLKDMTIPERVRQKRATISRSLSPEDIDLYWKQYNKAFSSERKNIWDGLLQGVTKYFAILKSRHTLNEQIQKLRLRNAELKHLLNKCTPSADTCKSTGHISIVASRPSSLIKKALKEPKLFLP